MHFLLKPEPYKKRSAPRRGGRAENLGSINTDLRVRVLKTIKARLNKHRRRAEGEESGYRPAVEKQIADMFLAVVRCHLRDWARNSLTKHAS